MPIQTLGPLSNEEVELSWDVGEESPAIFRSFSRHEFLQCVHPCSFQSGHLDLHLPSQFQKRHVGQKQMMQAMILMMLMCNFVLP